MIREQRYDIFYEFFNSKEKQEKRELLFNNELKKYNQTKTKLSKYINKYKDLVSNMYVKAENKRLSDFEKDAGYDKFTCKFKVTKECNENKEEKTYLYSEKIECIIHSDSLKRDLDINNKNDWYTYHEVVSLAQDNISSFIEKDGLGDVIEVSGKANELVLTIRMDSKRGLDRKKYK